MEIRPLSKSAFAVLTRSGVEILYSYGQPRAVYVPGRGVLISAWSSTASRSTGVHIAQFVQGRAAATISHNEVLKIAQEA